MATNEHRLPGRWAFDDRGNRTWEWEVRPGEFNTTIDTARVKALTPVDLGVAEKQQEQAFNPYDTGSFQKAPKRRTLDDMRRLNEQIKRSRKKP